MVLELSSKTAADVRSKSHSQRHRGYIVCFVTFVNGAGATSTFCSREKKVGGANDMACTPRWIHKRKRRGDFCFVKTTADVRQLCSRAGVSPQTCDKKKMDFSRWIFMSKKQLRLYWFYWCFWVFQRFEKKRWISRFHCVYCRFWSFFLSSFEVEILCDFQNR